MKCPTRYCNGKTGVTETVHVNEAHATYRRLKCKVCKRSMVSFEMIVTDPDFVIPSELRNEKKAEEARRNKALNEAAGVIELLTAKDQAKEGETNDDSAD